MNFFIFCNLLALILLKYKIDDNICEKEFLFLKKLKYIKMKLTEDKTN